MAISVKSTAFMTNPLISMTNPLISPTFLKDTPVILDKDYTQYDPFCSRYLTKNAVGRTIQCGLSKYAYDPETNQYSKLIDGEEWCFLEVATPIADFDNSEDWVKAEDLLSLRTLSDEDLVNGGLR